MNHAHDYQLQLAWDGDPAVGTETYAAYDRTFRVSIDGKRELVGSADPAFRGNPALHNPEDLFLASLASCHMLSYLALCARAGIRVLRYADEARGRLVVRRDGGGRFEQVTLRPRVEINRGSDVARATALHHDAHEQCFIAGSCNVPIACEPLVTVGAPTQAARNAARRQDLAVRLEDRPGALAELGELLGRAGVSLEGGGGFTVGNGCIVHFLVDDGDRAAAVLREAGLDVLGVHDVLAVQLDQDRPGQLGAFTRALATAGVNITSVYSDHDHHLIVCVDDLAAGQRVAATWQAGRA